MRLSLSNLFPSWLRNKAGVNFYDLTSVDDWGLDSDKNLEIAQKHPLLTPALLFVSKVFSQAHFHLERKSDGKKYFNSDKLKFLDNPNEFMTLPDFLETLMFIMIAQGVAVVEKKTIIGFENDIESMYILDKTLITWPEGIKPSDFRDLKARYKNQYVIYDKHGENRKIRIANLMFFYDLPNGLNKKNPFLCNSRLDGLKQTLINTVDSLKAKNIILKTNGKELISGDGKGTPFSPDEKERVEKQWLRNYGLGFDRKRGLVTRASLKWQSLHIALRDLGLDESTKVDGNIIYTALHIPKDILSLEAKKTTYNNFKESMVSYIQNEIQSSLNSFLAVLKKEIDFGSYRLVGSYEHMPIMKFVLIEKYDGIKKQGEALKILREAGVPDEVALEMCDFDKTLQLNELTITQNGQGQQQAEQQQ